MVCGYISKSCYLLVLRLINVIELDIIKGLFEIFEEEKSVIIIITLSVLSQNSSTLYNERNPFLA